MGGITAMILDFHFGEYREKRLTNDKGYRFTIDSESFNKVVISAYDTDKVIVQGRGEKQVKLVRGALKVYARIQKMMANNS